MTVTANRPQADMSGGDFGPARYDTPMFAELARETGLFSTELLDAYFDARAEASAVEKPVNGVLKEIQTHVSSWLTTDGPFRDGDRHRLSEYTTKDPGAAVDRIMALVDFLRAEVPEVSEAELRATTLFVQSTIGMYNSTPEDGSIHSDADGSFAFVVPARMSRHNTEYGQEVETVIPAFRYVPREQRAALMIGLPPFIIDRYNRTEDGKRGYLVLAPVFPDMIEAEPEPGDESLSVGDLLGASRELVNRAVDFAYGRLGAEVVGLGATLPKYTKYGQYITNPNVVTTTGHGGTIQLILETIRRANAESRVDNGLARKIGVLGLGAIGLSIAEIMRDEYPDADITVYDVRQKLTAEVAERIGAHAAGNEREVIERSGIVVSALPDIRLSLEQLGLTPDDLAGKLLVDDSQPAAFDLNEVKEFGATLAWVVGQDGDDILRSDYTYGDTLAGRKDLFGCEAEAAALARFNGELKARGYDDETRLRWMRYVAIRQAVTPQIVRTIGYFFKEYGITAAPLQAFGQYV